MYLKKESNDTNDKFTIKGFCGIVVFAIAKEAPAAPLSARLSRDSYNTNNINNNNKIPTTTPTPTPTQATTTPTPMTAKSLSLESARPAASISAPPKAQTLPAKPTAFSRPSSSSLPDKLAKEIISD